MWSCCHRKQQSLISERLSVYEQILQVPNYVVFDRVGTHLRVFKLVDSKYQEQDVRDGRYWLEDMAIGLGIWQGEFEGNSRQWLRWYDINGEWIPTKLEQQEKQAEQERSRRKETESENIRLKERLRELGIDPDEG